MKRFAAVAAFTLLVLPPATPAEGQVTLTLAGGPNLATLAYAEHSGTLNRGPGMGERWA